MRILVVDDESPTRENLRRLLAETDGDYELAGEAADGWEAIACCRSQPIDLVILDTQMPGMNGQEAARYLAALEQPPTIVLMASDVQDNPPSGDRGVAGCLAKPIQRDRLKEMLNLARRLRLLSEPKEGSLPTSRPPERRHKISAQYRGKVQSVAVADVIYLRADHKYVTVRHLSGELLVDESLRSFEDEFPDLFMRIHRNTLVARSRLLGLEKGQDGSTQARLSECSEQLPVSRRHLAMIRRWLNTRTPSHDGH